LQGNYFESFPSKMKLKRLREGNYFFALVEIPLKSLG
jgi:hypothetical protein